MKKLTLTFFALSIFSATFSAMAASVPCKLEAQKAIFERYSYEFPDSIISISSKYKPSLLGLEAVHVVHVTDLETGEITSMTAIMDSNTCKVKSVH